jgi:hypothetical protein
MRYKIYNCYGSWEPTGRDIKIVVTHPAVWSKDSSSYSDILTKYKHIKQYNIYALQGPYDIKLLVPENSIYFNYDFIQKSAALSPYNLSGTRQMSGVVRKIAPIGEVFQIEQIDMNLKLAATKAVKIYKYI